MPPEGTLADTSPPRSMAAPAPASEYLPVCDSMSGDQFAAYMDLQEEGEQIAS